MAKNEEVITPTWAFIHGEWIQVQNWEIAGVRKGHLRMKLRHMQHLLVPPTQWRTCATQPKG